MNKHIRPAILFIFLFGILQTSCTQEQPYVKHEYQIPMRDGKKLFTAVYIPKDDSKDYPILIWRTPYSVHPYGEDKFPKKFGPSRLFMKEGYIFVYQDVRGRFMSEGEYVDIRPYIPQKPDSLTIDETTDTYDTIDWLIKNLPNNNGRVGMWGISYPGFYSSMGLIDAHPALKAVSPQAPIADWFVGDDMHHNGAFTLMLGFNFFSTFG
ncbi:MAG TPA: CocE/NonD family hydrolase, partial [Calditrichaeota bacterium]|nr:CocE/NonD family hydrolase [Calditrichota bacterium]